MHPCLIQHLDLKSRAYSNYGLRGGPFITLRLLSMTQDLVAETDLKRCRCRCVASRCACGM